MLTNLSQGVYDNYDYLPYGELLTGAPERRRIAGYAGQTAPGKP